MASPSPVARQSAEEVIRLFRAAILERHAVKAVYAGYERWLCPYMLGRNKDGKRRVLCLQVDGGSVSGLRHQGQGDWRCLAVERFSAVERAACPWQTARDLRRPKCMELVELEVAMDQPEREPQKGQ